MNVMSQKEYISLLSRHLFWDMDVNKVNLDTCPAQIIQRVLEYGNLKDWQLILSYYGLDRIVSICQSLRTLDKKALSYICCISNTSKNNTDVIISNSQLPHFGIAKKADQ